MRTLLLGATSKSVRHGDWTLVSNADTIRHVFLEGLEGPNLLVIASGMRVRVPVDSIRYLLQDRPTAAWTGFSVGMLTGTVAGIVLAANAPDPSGGYLVGGAAAGALAGALVGSAFGGKRSVVLTQRGTAERTTILTALVEDAWKP